MSSLSKSIYRFLPVKISHAYTLSVEHNCNALLLEDSILTKPFMLIAKDKKQVVKLNGLVEYISHSLSLVLMQICRLRQSQALVKASFASFV